MKIQRISTAPVLSQYHIASNLPESSQPEFSCPEFSCPISVGKNDQIQIDLSLDASKFKRVIYCFTNHTNGKRLIGATDDFVQRMKSYQLPEKLEFDVRYGDQVSVTILQKVSNSDDIDKLEDDYIQFYDSINNGYNQRKGGGGGTSVERKSTETTPRTKRAIKKAIQELHETPEKSATLVRSPTSKKVRLKATELFKEDAKKSDIYFMRHTEKKTEYVGTSQDIPKRLREHNFYINNTENSKYKRKINPVHEKSSQSPEKMVIKAIQTDKIKKRVFEETGNTPSSMELETGFIDHYNSYEKGDNKTRGGNGSMSKKVLK